jgi:hypothetical protein
VPARNLGAVLALRGAFAAAAAALTAAAVCPPPAAAEAVKSTAYAGGALTPSAPLVGLRVDPTGRRIAFDGGAIVRCARGRAVDERLIVRTAIAASGRFSGTLRRARRVSRVETRVIRLTVIGRTIDRRRAHGTLRLMVTVRRREQAPVSCNSGTVRWQARSVTGLPPASPARPLSGALFGATLQPAGAAPFPFALRVTRDRRRVDAIMFRIGRRCQGAASDQLPNNMPGARIRPRGSFYAVQRYRQRFTDSIEDFQFQVSGRFTIRGATGTVRATSVLRDPRTGRVVGRCSSGPVAWVAVR